MPPGPTSPYFTIDPTPYGGRGVFASQNIPKDTLILTCKAPYASVVYRKFRKEVCAWCFSWSWEAVKKGSWSINVGLEPQHASEGGKTGGGQKRNGMGGPNAGVWFCGEECRSAWIADDEDTTCTQGNHAGVRGIINAVLERRLATMEKDKAKPRTVSISSGVELGWLTFLQSLEDLDSTTKISSAFVENVWEQAEILSSFSRSSTPVAKDIISSNRKSNTKLVPVSPTMLTEFELDTARFVLAGLLKKCVEELSEANSSSEAPAGIAYPASTWSDVLDLQDNSLAHIQAKPHILAFHVRVWVFIKFIVYSAIRETKYLSERTYRLVHLLKKSVDTPHDTRAILGREHGNVFGIWDMAPEGMDSEMLGWGLYPFGSYFNHDCSPTLRKKCKGRVIEYYTIRDVNAGEELCIAYVETNQGVEQRREALREWFFDCACMKCARELQNCSTSSG